MSSFSQVLVSLLFLNLLHALNLVVLKGYSRSLGERLLLPAICNSVQAVLTMWAKASSSSATLFLVTVPLLPLVTLALSFILKLRSPPSLHSSALISIISGMVIVITGKLVCFYEQILSLLVKKCVFFFFISTASKGLQGVEPLEYIYAPLALILHSISLISLTKVSEAERHRHPDTQASAIDIYHTQMVNQSWLLGFLWLLHPDNPWQVLSQSSWHSLLFHGYLLAIILLGMVLNFMVGMSALCVSPLAAALLYSTRQIIQPLLQLL